MTEQAELKLIDWSTVGGVVWRAHVCNGDARWRQWRRPGREPMAYEGERVEVVFEAAVYPWTVITGAMLMGAL